MSVLLQGIQPVFTVCERTREQYSLVGMEPEFAIWRMRGLTLNFRSRGGVVDLVVFLDFPNERLMFDPLAHFKFAASRVNSLQIEEELAAVRFLFALMCNGHVELWDSGTERRLGRSDVYIPMNMMVNADWFKTRIADLEALLQQG